MTDYDKYAFWLITVFPCAVFAFSFPSSCHILIPGCGFSKTGRAKIAANIWKSNKTAFSPGGLLETGGRAEIQMSEG